MRFSILIIFCTISFTASAQFWQKSPKKVRYPEIAYSLPQPNTTINETLAIGYVNSVQLSRSIYSIELAEQAVLKEAKHNMRFRIYNLASYNFSDLAALYVQQNRFSEAKWYLLQSNTIARQQDDTKHILSNLLALAVIKAQIGEQPLAIRDLQEAHAIATTKGMQTDLAEINKRLLFLQTNKIVTVKIESRYDEAVEIANSKIVIN